MKVIFIILELKNRNISDKTWPQMKIQIDMHELEPVWLKDSMILSMSTWCLSTQLKAGENQQQ